MPVIKKHDFKRFEEIVNSLGIFLLKIGNASLRFNWNTDYINQSMLNFIKICVVLIHFKEIFKGIGSESIIKTHA